MKRTLKILMTVIVGAAAMGAAHAETLTANLTLSSAIGAQCNPALGRGFQSIVWKGVEDKRADRSVGVMKKGDAETDISSSEPVEKLFDRGMRAVLEKCGFALASSPNANGVQVSVDLNEFFAGAKKGLIMGETEAKGLMTVNMVRSGRAVDLEFGASVQDKGLRKKNVKKLEAALSEVLATMVNKIASTSQFADAMKDLSK